MRDLVPETILGWDDWLVFGQTADGTLVFTVTETDWHWLDAPHGGGSCWDESTGRNCNGETRSACRGDLAWMLAWVTGHKSECAWQECSRDADGTSLAWPASRDTAFTAASHTAYLPREQET